MDLIQACISGRRCSDARCDNTVLHDSRQSMFTDFVLHVMPALPTDNPNGGIFPTASERRRRAGRSEYSDQLIDAVDDATAYTEDFLTEMQNVLLGDLYGNHLDPRQPLDPRRRAVTLDQAQELAAWFRSDTAWSAEAARVEAQTRERFLAKQDGAEHG